MPPTASSIPGSSRPTGSAWWPRSGVGPPARCAASDSTEPRERVSHVVPPRIHAVGPPEVAKRPGLPHERGMTLEDPQGAIELAHDLPGPGAHALACEVIPGRRRMAP